MISKYLSPLFLTTLCLTATVFSYPFKPSPSPIPHTTNGTYDLGPYPPYSDSTLSVLEYAGTIICSIPDSMIESGDGSIWDLVLDYPKESVVKRQTFWVLIANCVAAIRKDILQGLAQVVKIKKMIDGFGGVQKVAEMLWRTKGDLTLITFEVEPEVVELFVILLGIAATEGVSSGGA
jgi:hypothetical protein